MKYKLDNFLKVYITGIGKHRDTNRKTKKALGGLFGLLGSFLAFLSFLVVFGALLFSGLEAAFRFPTFL
jgi:hypothetical protein